MWIPVQISLLFLPGYLVPGEPFTHAAELPTLKQLNSGISWPTLQIHCMARSETRRKRIPEQLSSLQDKNCKTCPIFFFSNTQKSNGCSRDMVGQDTAYAQVGLMDWQQCQFSGLTLKQRHNTLCSLCVALKVVFNLLQQTFYSSF